MRMLRSFAFTVVTFALLTCLSAAAQAPKGWKMRVDRSMEASDPDGTGEIKFVTMGSGFHATNPQAAVYWNPANNVTGSYTLKGTFVLQKPSGHANYYGLVFGGSGLEGAQQKYTYFLVAQNGTWLIKTRDGAATANVVGRTPNDAVKKPGEDGKSTNALEVRVGGDKTDFVVNGTVVHSAPKSASLMTDGLWGARVNHQLEVHIDGLRVSK